jgi:hypothetical protein
LTAQTGTLTSGGTKCAEANGRTERAPDAEREPRHRAPDVLHNHATPMVQRTSDSRPSTGAVVPYQRHGYPLGCPCGCAGRGFHEDDCPSRRRPFPAALEASRAAWEHLRFCGLLDREGYVEGILRELGRVS